MDGSSPNNQIVYRIQKGASDKFSINAENGIISVARGASLDPDLTQPRTTSYSLTVLALDGASGEEQLQADVTVNITVLDVNNKSPTIADPGVINVLENVPVSPFPNVWCFMKFKANKIKCFQVGSILTRLRAKDLDENAILRFRLDPKQCEAKTERGTLLPGDIFSCDKYFKLGETDGVITTAKTLDRELFEVVILGVIIEDVASESGLQIDTGITHV